MLLLARIDSCFKCVPLRRGRSVANVAFNASLVARDVTEVRKGVMRHVTNTAQNRVAEHDTTVESRKNYYA